LAGQATTLSYSGGRLASITDPANRVTQFTHDGDGNLTRITYADTSEVRLDYDPQHRLTQRTDGRGKVYEYAYDYAGRFMQATLPTGEIRKLTPTQRAAVPDLAAGEGTKQAPAPLAAPNPPASFQDGNGHTSSFTLDALGRITKQTDALNRVTTIERDAQGNPAKITRPNGAVTVMTYDSKGNLLTSTEQAIAATTTFTYEPTFNQVTSIKDPKNNTTTITYDAKGNPLTITDADNKVTQFEYDTRGLLTAVKDALFPVHPATTFTYDTLGRLLTTTDPLNRTTTLTYDNAGNVATSTDALNRTTSFEYDAFNRLKKVTDPATGVTEYTYDGNGNLVTVKDAKDQTTTFTYDAKNRLASTTDPLGKTETYEYDGADNLLTRVTPKNDTISFAYDAVNRLLSKTLPGNQVTSFTYDTAGNLTGVTDPDSQLTMTYDLANRLTSVSMAGSSNQPSVTLTYTYDKNGNRLTLVDPAGTNTYVYDALNRLTSLTSPAGATTYAFDALSRRTSVTLPNSTQTTYTYDPASQVTNILHKVLSTTAIINSAGYVYNNVGNRTSLTDRRGVQSFGYDPLDRLTSATHPLTLDQAFSYDPVGNSTTNGSQHNAANQLTEDANFTYTYDANGNLISKTFKSSGNHTDYTYDVENRLIRVDEFAAGSPTPGATSTYRYDGLGRRIEKVANGQTRRYVYDGEDILLEYDGTNTLQARYTHGPGIDEPIAMQRGGVNHFYHQDSLGTVTELTDSTGATAQSYAYDSYGNIVQQTGTVENPYTYAGREFDAETGLYYYRARYYDPRIGRFLQKDPIGLRGGLNVFSYVGNNPLKYIDPFGLYGTSDFVLHYCLGGESPIDLGAVGLLGAFQNSASVSNSVGAFKEMARATAKMKAQSLCGICDKGTKTSTFNLKDPDITNVRNEPDLYSVGNSTFFRSAQCSVSSNCSDKTFNFTCSLNFSIRDWFRRPLGENVPEVPLCKPYRINANWSDSVSGSGAF
jgi:RHS repeat-associated protein